MAAAKTTPKRAAKNGSDPVGTAYVVLEQRELFAKGLAEVEQGQTASSPARAKQNYEPVTAWAPVLANGEPRIIHAASKLAAIKAHTGDGAAIVEGTFRAIPVSSWKGGMTTKRVTAAERLPID